MELVQVNFDTVGEFQTHLNNGLEIFEFVVIDDEEFTLDVVDGDTKVFVNDDRDKCIVVTKEKGTFTVESKMY